MLKVVSINSKSNSVSPTALTTIQFSSLPISQTDFFKAYGDKTPDLVISMLDAFYTSYKTMEQYQCLSFAEKVDIEFRFEVLRGFIRGLKR